MKPTAFFISEIPSISHSFNASVTELHPTCQGNLGKTRQCCNSSRRSPIPAAAAGGERSRSELSTLHWGCSRSGPLASIKLLDWAPQMISATVEPHAEPLTSQTYDTNPLWPCELMWREMGLAPPCLQGLGSPWRAPGLKMLLQPHLC